MISLSNTLIQLIWTVAIVSNNPPLTVLCPIHNCTLCQIEDKRETLIDLLWLKKKILSEAANEMEEMARF